MLIMTSLSFILDALELTSAIYMSPHPGHGEPLLLLEAQDLGPTAAREPAVGLPGQQLLQPHLPQALTSEMRAEKKLFTSC